jgi:hypothetical protein
MIPHSKVSYQLFEIGGFEGLYEVNCIREGAGAMHSDDVPVLKSKLYSQSYPRRRHSESSRIKPFKFWIIFRL